MQPNEPCERSIAIYLNLKIKPLLMKVAVITFLLIFPFLVCSQSDILINEFMASNEGTIADDDGDYTDWIELYNDGTSAIDLNGYSISDDPTDPSLWVFPSFVIQPGEHRIIFASGKDKLVGPYLHTNFKISSSGEPLFLMDASGTQVDYVPPTPLTDDVSYGRSEDGHFIWERLTESTPVQPNAQSNGVVFSHQSGFYAATIDLDLSATNGQTIRYTIDGSNPDSTSNLYSAPLTLENLDLVPDTISMVPTSPSWSTPDLDNFKAHIIKAATFNGGIRTSNIFTKVIFVSPDLNSRYEEFDIVSIVTDSENLFNADTGIYVPGVNFSTSNTTWTGNYFQKGDLWEREANLQYFDNNGELRFNQEIGIRTHGGKGRNLPQKSLRIYTRGEQGAPKLNYPFFEHLGESKREFDKVVLRNSLTCWNNSVIKDEVTAEICKNLNFEIQNSKPVVVFINGEYWGVQCIREYYDEKYILEKFDNIEEDSINIVLHGSGNRPSLPSDWGTVEGTNDGHIQLYEFLNNNDLDVSSNYQYVESVLDMESIVDYYCAEIYFNNKDWPTNNNKLWNVGASGKWRQMLYDVDGGWQYLGVSYDQLTRATAANGTAQNSPYATFLLRKLFESPEFEERFVARMACLMKNDFDADTVVETIEFMRDLYEDGMQEHIDRWHKPNSYSTWIAGINGLISFANNCKDHVITHIENKFGITFDPDEYDCTIIDTSSVSELDLSNQLRVYPNPSSNQSVWVDFDFTQEEIDYQVYSLNGNLMDKGTISNHEKLTMNYASGMYLISFQVQGERIVKRIIID